MKHSMVIACACLLTVAVQADVKDSVVATSHAARFDPSRNAAADVRQAIIDASDSGRRILLDVGGNWCTWCTMLDAFFEADTAAARCLRENFIVVKVNFSKENKNDQFLAQYPKVPGYPHFFILDSDGSFLYSQNTATLEQDKGYSAEKIMAFLKTWAK